MVRKVLGLVGPKLARLPRLAVVLYEKASQRISQDYAPLQPVLLLSVVAGWCLYVFLSYLPALAPTNLSLRAFDFHLRRSGAYDVFLTVWFAAAAYCAGKRLLRFVGVGAVRGAEGAAFSMAAGVSIFSWLTMVLALVNGLYRPVGYALLVIPTLIWHAEMKRLPGEIRRLVVTKLRSVSWSATGIAQALLAGYILTVLGVVFLSTLAPSFEYDDLVYHLAGPKNFVQHHRFVPLPDVPLVFFPKNIEMLYTLGMLWHSDITAKLINFLLAILTLVAVYGFANRFLSRAHGMIAIAVLVSSPLWIWEMKTAHNDLGLGLYAFCGVYAAAVWLWEGSNPWLRVAAICFAFGLGVKYWALLAVGVAVSLVFIVRLHQTRAVAKAIAPCLRLGLYSAVGLVPWGLVNLYYTGNPVFPLLNNVFQSPYWTPAHTQMALREMHQIGIRITLSNLWELVTMWWTMMVDPRSTGGGNVGPFYVMLLPLFLLLSAGAAPQVWFVLVFSGLYYAGWAISGPWGRFLLPALPGFALASAFGVEKLLRLLRRFRREFAITAAAFLLLLAVLASPFFESYGAWSRYGSMLIGSMSLKYLAGWESKSDYLTRHYPAYRAIRFLNGISGPRKVMYVHALPDGFYLDGKAAFHYSPYLPALVVRNADQIHSVLRQNGITHLLVYQENQFSSPLSSRESAFNRVYTRKLYHRNAVIVYELLPEAVLQEAVAFDFLNNLRGPPVEPTQEGKPPRHWVEIRNIDGDRRYAMGTMPPAEVDFPLTICDQPVLSFASAKENPECTGKGSFQVWISSPHRERRLLYRRDLPGGSGAGWTETKLDLAGFAGQRVVLTFKTEGVSSCGGYFWADPVLIARNGVVGKSLKVVTGMKVEPATVRIGGSITASFFGPALTPETSFDLRIRTPDGVADEIVVDWQRGTSARHTIPNGTVQGKWIITGLRAHDGISDHDGDFHPVWITLEVTR
jgi:hypothetical protein